MPAACSPPCLLEQRLGILWRVGNDWWWRCNHRHDEQPDDATIDITMLEFAVDRNDPTPLHDQVAAKIRRAIADGEAHPGDRLPPAKDLAAVLEVNSNTVLRALRLLRDEGLLEFRRGRGITVAGTANQSAVINRARELVEYARSHGYHVDELIHIIENA